MFAIVAINFEAFQALPPFDFKLMAAVLRYVNRQGECCPTLHQLADDVLSSEATVSRAMARLARQGCFTRERQGNGRYLYRVAERYLARRNGKRTPSTPRETKMPIGVLKKENPPIGGFAASGGTSSIELVSADSHLALVQVRLAHAARQEVAPSSDQRSSEGEQQPSQQDEIPDGWEEAAAAERRLAGLPKVNLKAEWRKLLAYSEGARITIWRWRGWVLKARCNPPVITGAAPENIVTADTSLPGDERQQRQARDWVRRGFWLRSGAWGPAPDQAGCDLPPGLIAWCLREQRTRAA